MEMNKELVDRLLGEYRKPEDLIGENGLLKQLTKALVERALAAEIPTHLGYEKHSPESHHSGNTPNRVSPKQLKGEFGEVQIEVPRDRQASFEPKLVAKGQHRQRPQLPRRRALHPPSYRPGHHGFARNHADRECSAVAEPTCLTARRRFSSRGLRPGVFYFLHFSGATALHSTGVACASGSAPSGTNRPSRTS